MQPTQNIFAQHPKHRERHENTNKQIQYKMRKIGNTMKTKANTLNKTMFQTPRNIRTTTKQ